jgi:hypothetical protein
MTLPAGSVVATVGATVGAAATTRFNTNCALIVSTKASTGRFYLHEKAVIIRRWNIFGVDK